MTRTVIVSISVLLFFGVISTTVARTADYPTKPMEIFVGYPVGSSPDVITRIIGDVTPKFTGQPVVMVNKLGASGSMAATEVLAKPDDYKLTAQTNLFFASTMKIQKVPFDPNNLSPVASFAEFRQEVMVRADSPFKTLADLLDYGRKNPGRLKWVHLGDDRK